VDVKHEIKWTKKKTWRNHQLECKY